MREVILEVKNVTKCFDMIDGKQLIACNQLCFNLFAGEILGIVGESGCGKSTLLKMISGMTSVNSGEILYQNKDISHLKGKNLRKHRSHIQMVFQNPNASFYQKMKIVDALSEPLKNYRGMNKKACQQMAGDLLESVGLPREFAKRYPHALSGGQCQRLAIARAIAAEPSILICDEATSALDTTSTQNIVSLIQSLQVEKKLSTLFVCHDIALVNAISHRILVMYLGNIVETLPGGNIRQEALHPYTQLLLDSTFVVGMEKETMQNNSTIANEITQTTHITGCPFHPRCKYAMPLCKEQKPMLQTLREGHEVACHRVK